MASNIHFIRSCVLHTEGLCVVRNERLILKDLNWRLSKGENWVILGPNGSGKTSLLKCLAGYLTPSAGAISVLGQVYGESDWRELRKSIGLVSSSVHQMISDEELAVDAVASGKQAILNSWKPASGTEREKAMRLLRRVECIKLAEQPWGVLSNGERQRVQIARALMTNPRLLILDEPCTGLDPVARQHFLRFIQELATRKNSPALIFVTHHVEEIVPAFTHALVLKQGKVAGCGPIPKTLTSRILSDAFSTPIRLSTKNGRHQISVEVGGHAIA